MAEQTVGAVPVEVPADLLDAAAEAIAETDDENGCFERVREYEAIAPGAERDDYERAHGYPHADYEDCDYYRRRAAAAYSLIAARVRAEGEKRFAEAERILEQAIRERDEAEEWADKLAAALAGDAAGEHSSANNPWQNALGIAASHDARVRAEERRRVGAELIRRAEAADRADLASIGDALDVSQCRHGHRADTYRAAARIAAGCAVPVATPVVAMHGDHGFAPGVDVDMAREGRQPDPRWCNNCGESIAGPVATPVEPVDEVVCPNCEHTIRARMSDQPDAEQDGQR